MGTGRAVLHPGERLPWDEPPRHAPGDRPTVGAAPLSRARLVRWALVAALVLGPFLAAEAVVRTLIATGRLPAAAAHLADFEITWTNLERLGRPPDVLLLGDSITQQGLDPAALGELIEPVLGRRVIVFNAASSSGGFGVNRAVVDELARQGRLPPIAVLGVSPSSLASDRTFREVFAPTPMGGLFTRCALATGYDAVVNCRAGEVSALWRWRGAPDRLLAALARPTPRTASRQGFLLRSDGFREGPPAAIATLREQLPVALSKEPATFSLGDDVPAAYGSLVAELRAHGVRVVAVAIPYSPVLLDALEARRVGWDAARAAAVRQLAATTGAPILDPGRLGDWWGDGSSRDVKHLSREGAPKFVKQLWALPQFRDAILASLR